MSGPWQVARLKVAAPERATVGSFARALETALRLARAPSRRPGELVLIRRLELGPVAAGTSAHALADRLGRLLADARPIRLRPGDPERPDAAAVSFAGTIDAAAALLLHVARPEPLRAWYWRRVLPGLREDASLPAAAAAGFSLAQAEGRGIAGAAALAESLLGAPDGERALAAVLLALAPGGAGPQPARLPKKGPSRTAGEGFSQAPDALARALPRAWRALITRLAAQLAADDPRIAWTVTLATAAVLGPAVFVARPADLVASLTRVGAAHDPHRRAPTAHPPARARQDTATARQAGLRPEVVASVKPAIAPGSRLRVEPVLPAEPVDAAPETGPFSRGAGLWLLPAALARLRVEAVLSPFGDTLGVALMRLLAGRLRMLPDDPALAGLPQALPAVPGPLLVPAHWRRLAAPHARAAPGFALRRAGAARLLACRTGRLPLAWAVDHRELRELVRGGPVRRLPDVPAPDASLALRAVYLALVRDLRRHAGISLRRLVCRVGLVETTATHVDVTFPGRLIELPLRRAGLDLDPGWVPWLGRVVTYHYDLEGEVFR